MNVIVSANRDWRQQDVDRAQAIAQFFGQVQGMGLPPNVISILAKEAGMSQAAVTALAEAMSQPPPPPPGMGQPPQGGPPMPEGPMPGGPPAQPMSEGSIPQ
jgi:hypothetical protein